MTAQTIARLREQIDELNETILQLRQQIRGPLLPALPFKISPGQRIILRLLFNHAGLIVPTERFIAGLDSSSLGPETLLKVLLVDLRRKLVPYGVKIHNEFDIGYWMSKADAEKLRAALDNPVF